MLWRKPSKREEFERVVQSVFPSIFSTALRLTRNREEAEDLVQEAVVRGFQAYDRFDGQNFKAWILRILTNLYINRYRKSQREPGVDSLDSEAVSERVIGDDVFDTAFFSGLLGEQVEEALQSLPEEYRITVMLSDVEGLSYDEISKALEIPIGTVRSRLARGRAQLREKLLGYAQQEGYLKGSQD